MSSVIGSTDRAVSKRTPAANARLSSVSSSDVSIEFTLGLFDEFGDGLDGFFAGANLGALLYLFLPYLFHGAGRTADNLAHAVRYE